MNLRPQNIAKVHMCAQDMGVSPSYLYIKTSLCVCACVCEGWKWDVWGEGLD